MKSEDKNRFMYIRDTNRAPVGCIAFRIEGNVVRFGTSILNPSEKNHDPKRGREIAAARLDTPRGRLNEITIANDAKLFDVTRGLLVAVRNDTAGQASIRPRIIACLDAMIVEADRKLAEGKTTPAPAK